MTACSSKACAAAAEPLALRARRPRSRRARQPWKLRRRCSRPGLRTRASMLTGSRRSAGTLEESETSAFEPGIAQEPAKAAIPIDSCAPRLTLARRNQRRPRRLRRGRASMPRRNLRRRCHRGFGLRAEVTADRSRWSIRPLNEYQNNPVAFRKILQRVSNNANRNRCLQ